MEDSESDDSAFRKVADGNASEMVNSVNSSAAVSDNFYKICAKPSDDPNDRCGDLKAKIQTNNVVSVCTAAVQDDQETDSSDATSDDESSDSTAYDSDTDVEIDGRSHGVLPSNGLPLELSHLKPTSMLPTLVTVGTDLAGKDSSDESDSADDSILAAHRGLGESSDGDSGDGVGSTVKKICARPIRTRKQWKKLSYDDDDDIFGDILPGVEKLSITVEEEKCSQIGSICSIVGQIVVIQSIKGLPALDLDTVLFLEKGNQVLGQVHDVIGPVTEPFYCIKLCSDDQIKEQGITIGKEVFYAPQTEHTKFVFISELKKIKGSDASWEDDREPPPIALDFSDDEAERRYKKELRERGERMNGNLNPLLDCDEQRYNSKKINYGYFGPETGNASCTRGQRTMAYASQNVMGNHLQGRRISRPNYFSRDMPNSNGERRHPQFTHPHAPNRYSDFSLQPARLAWPPSFQANGVSSQDQREFRCPAPPISRPHSSGTSFNPFSIPPPRAPSTPAPPMNPFAMPPPPPPPPPQQQFAVPQPFGFGFGQPPQFSASPFQAIPHSFATPPPCLSPSSSSLWYPSPTSSRTISPIPSIDFSGTSSPVMWDNSGDHIPSRMTSTGFAINQQSVHPTSSSCETLERPLPSPSPALSLISSAYDDSDEECD